MIQKIYSEKKRHISQERKKSDISPRKLLLGNRVTVGAHAYRRTVERRAVDSMKANKTKKGQKKKRKEKPSTEETSSRHLWLIYYCARYGERTRQGLKSVIDKG